jgi:hypothetical protein
VRLCRALQPMPSSDEGEDINCLASNVIIGDES